MATHEPEGRAAHGTNTALFSAATSGGEIIRMEASRIVRRARRPRALRRRRTAAELYPQCKAFLGAADVGRGRRGAGVPARGPRLGPGVYDGTRSRRGEYAVARIAASGRSVTGTVAVGNCESHSHGTRSGSTSRVELGVAALALAYASGAPGPQIFFYSVTE